MKAKLFEVERQRRLPTSTTLVHVPMIRCPNCNGSLELAKVWEPTLFRGWGYGATRRTTINVCSECNSTWVRDVTEVNPKGMPCR